MFDLGRLRGMGLALASVALGLGAFWGTLRWATDCRPEWFPAVPSKMDVTALERAGSRIARAARDGRLGTRGDDRLGVILGSSSMLSALDPALLADGYKEGPARWLNLCGPDENPLDLERIARLLDRAGVRPSVVVGINLPALARAGDLLADAVPDDPAPIATLWSEPPRPPSSGAARLLRSLVHLVRDAGGRLRPNFLKFSHIKNLALFEGRVAILLAAGVGIDGAFAPAPDDWTPPATWISPTTEEFCAWQMREYTRKGWFSADAFGPDGPNVRALEGLVVGLRRRGARVVLVLLPESSRLRGRVPPEAMRWLAALLGSLAEGDAPELLDLRAALDDAVLVDLVHLGVLGREEATRRLARHLAGPPATAGRP
jgi:hypothetical protein